MMNRFYLVEGETEQAFFECLKESRFIAPGKIRKYNLMQKAVTPGEYFLSFRNPELICVIDTDVITDNTPGLPCPKSSISHNKNPSPIGKGFCFANYLFLSRM